MTLKKIAGFIAIISFSAAITCLLCGYFIQRSMTVPKITNLLQVSRGVYLVESVEDKGISVVDGRHEFIYGLKNVVSGEKFFARDNVHPKTELPVGTTLTISGYMEMIAEYPRKSP